jgi:hypothetical protein
LKLTGHTFFQWLLRDRGEFRLLCVASVS